MNMITYQKVINVSYFVVAAVLISSPDMVFGLLTEFIYFIFEVSTIIIEYIEIFLDHLIGNIFHTAPHQTQVATFYVLTALGTVCFYYLWRSFFYIVLKIKAGIASAYLQKKMQVRLFWENQSLLNKAKWVGIGTTGFTVLVLFGG